ncbi:MAG: PQQ-binding-like beta-propeller repeat protein, partial [Thaumarchaeota archaeon]|nr:PQQ-binding-like beta-propeller repeat protein [Nitrososphaerota archaeon]
MTKISIKKSIIPISISLLFIFSSMSVPTAIASANSSSAAPAATPLTALQANWAYPNGNQFNWNYNPQNVINSSNAQYLGLSWLFPLPTHPTALLSVTGGLGVDTAPLIINGTVYAVTQYGQVFALNAANGNVLWTDVLPLTANSTAGQGVRSLSLHLHDGEIAFTTALFGGTPTVWISAPDHYAYAINALTGKYELNFSYYGKGGVAEIAGNNPNSLYSGSSANIVIDQKRGIMVTSMLSTSFDNAARCFFRGWNILVNPPQLLWTAYCTPPQPGSSVPLNPNWDAQQIATMKGAWIFKGYGYDKPGGYGGPEGALDLKSLSPAALNATFYNDWGYAQSAHCTTETAGASTGATGSGWGASWIIDQKTGIAYINTGNKGPYNSDCSAGPNLWSAAVMALNDTTGQWVWGFQAAAHELWDFDCSWQQVLANETISGVNTQVLFKTCKSGYLFALNAATGSLIWSWTPPTSIMPRCHYCYMLDPQNSSQMNWAFFNPNLQTTIMYPNEYAGSENSFSYNPQLNYIFMVTHNVPFLTQYVQMNATNYGQTTGSIYLNSASGQGLGNGLDNSTVEAVNAASGQMVWSHFIATQGYRGGVTTSGNVVYLTLSSGDLLMLNAQTGAVLKDLYIGGPLNVLPSIGATASGTMQVIISITAGSVTWANGVPGDLVALNLQNVPTGTTNTVTSTSTTTTTVAGGGSTVTSTTTVGGGATVTSTTTVGGAGSTVTVSGAGSVTTSVTTITSSGGV